jgi:hypothetical protein
MPKRIHAFIPFSLRDATGDYVVYRCVLVSCGKARCRSDRHGPYLYARVKTLEGKWRETYIGTLDSRPAQDLIRRAARRDPYYEPYLLPDNKIR